MTTAFCLGNGLSRKNIDLNWLKNYGSIYGCNGLYRDFKPNVLIATDRPIATDIQQSGYSKDNKFYTRRPIEGLGALQIPKKYYGNSSGPVAVALAALDNHKVIYMLGYDMGPTLAGKFNNIYADTDHYKKSFTEPTYTGNWIRQIVMITKDFPDVVFVRVKGDTTAEINDFHGIANLQHEPMSTFQERINNQKEFKCPQ